jgi:hypothetical protein
MTRAHPYNSGKKKSGTKPGDKKRGDGAGKFHRQVNKNKGLDSNEKGQEGDEQGGI